MLSSKLSSPYLCTVLLNKVIQRVIKVLKTKKSPLKDFKKDF
ncbi:hypothetical protein [Bacillus phage SP8]|nr:hypothetical protein [Bacillus phage SP8]